MTIPAIGRFLGRPPSLDFLRQENLRKWKTKGQVHVMDLVRGFYIFRFMNEEDKNMILAQGPWTPRGQPLNLFSWKSGFDPLTADIGKSSIWIQLINLPIELRTKKLIESVAAHFGAVLQVDDMTLNDARGSFCRVCVEANLNDAIKNGIWLELEGRDYFQIVQYECLPIMLQELGTTKTTVHLKLKPTRAPSTFKEANVTKTFCQEYTEKEMAVGSWVQVDRRHMKRTNNYVQMPRRENTVEKQPEMERATEISRQPRLVQRWQKATQRLIFLNVGGKNSNVEDELDDGLALRNVNMDLNEPTHNPMAQQ